MEMSGAQIVDFNCTIQELKQQAKKLLRMMQEDFNCTIQELKPRRNGNVQS